jgi:manganese/zinc/iron transport system ATP- binding protein
MNVIDVEGLTVNYGDTPVLWDVSLQIPEGVLVGILGPNGAGKSTLLKTLLRLTPAMSGRVEFFTSSPFQEARKKIAYVPQRGSVDWDFPITAFEVVLMGRYGKLSWLGRPRAADRIAAKRALELVGMQDFADTQIGQLSGGQQQRIFIARALVQNGDLLFLDEPFAGVDLTTEKAMMSLLKKQTSEKKTICVVHHDLPTVEEYFDWVIMLNQRLITVGPTKEVFTKENIELTFGKNQVLFEEAARLSAKSMSGIL